MSILTALFSQKRTAGIPEVSPVVEIDTELRNLEANVRPKIKEFMLSKNLTWAVCWIKLTRELEDGNSTFVVNIHGPKPGEFIGPGGELSKDLCMYLGSAFQRRFYINAKDNQFDPFAAIYQTTPLN